MAIPAFTINFGQYIQPGLVAVGRCEQTINIKYAIQTNLNLILVDGKSPSLACGTSGGKVLLHSPHEGTVGSDGNLPSVRFLNLNRKITSLAAGMFLKVMTI